MNGGATPSWTVIIVPPSPTNAPKRVGVKMRTLRMLVMLGAAVLSLGWFVYLESADYSAMMADRLVDEQRARLALIDTVEFLRSASLADWVKSHPPANMMMPVHGEITSRFARSRFHPILQIFRAHRGVDLAAPAGTKIASPAAGVVTSVGWRFGYGLTIEVAHTGGVSTRYAHCRGALVHEGDHVAMGQGIGTVGSSGLATAPHLHFEVLVHGNSVDPIKFLASTQGLTPPMMPTPAVQAPQSDVRH